MISAIVLTKNGQVQIQNCLKSLLWCEEIIVIDDESKDGTRDKINELASKNIKIFTNKLEGDFAAQHNFGLGKATHDWVLFVDDDEVVNTKLVQEIKQATKSTQFNGYYLSRKDFFMGRVLFHGETGGAKFIRLGRRVKGKWQRKVHESWQIDGNIGQLATPLEHFPHPTIQEFISSINQYTSIDAKELKAEGKEFSPLRTVVNPIAKFVQNYFWRLGFMDGMPGLIMAFMMSFHSLTVRIKQYELYKST